LFSTVVGTILGIISASRPYSLRDNAITILTLTLASLPWFWLGELLIIVLSLYLGLFPTGGFSSIGTNIQSLGGVANVLWHLTLPLLALSTYNLATVARQLRASLIRTMDYDFIKTARSKGLGESKIIFRHALRNAISPVIVIAGLNTAYLFGAVMVLENIFSWPGMGQLLYESILRRDYPVIMGVFFVSSIIVMLINLAADIIIALVDPRVGLQ
jgi:peptide/nickel transport system permease protein